MVSIWLINLNVGCEKIMASTLKAFILAPLLPAIIGSLALHPDLLFFSIFVSYLCTLMVGVPLYLFVRRFGQVSFLSCSLGGAIAGALVALALLSADFELSFYFLKATLPFVAFGAMAGIAFGLMLCPSTRGSKKICMKIHALFRC